MWPRFAPLARSMLHCSSLRLRRLGGGFELARRLALLRLRSSGRGRLCTRTRRWKNFEDLDDAVALRKYLVIGTIGGLEIDPAAERIARADVEFAPVEFVEQGAGLAIGDRSRIAVLQLPLAGRLIIGHLDDEDHIGRMIDQLARLQQRPGFSNGLGEIELRRPAVGRDADTRAG